MSRLFLPDNRLAIPRLAMVRDGLAVCCCNLCECAILNPCELFCLAIDLPAFTSSSRCERCPEFVASTFYARNLLGTCHWAAGGSGVLGPLFCDWPLGALKVSLVRTLTGASLYTTKIYLQMISGSAFYTGTAPAEGTACVTYTKTDANLRDMGGLVASDAVPAVWEATLRDNVSWENSFIAKEDLNSVTVTLSSTRTNPCCTYPTTATVRRDTGRESDCLQTTLPAEIEFPSEVYVRVPSNFAKGTPPGTHSWITDAGDPNTALAGTYALSFVSVQPLACDMGNYEYEFPTPPEWCVEGLLPNGNYYVWKQKVKKITALFNNRSDDFVTTLVQDYRLTYFNPQTLFCNNTPWDDATWTWPMTAKSPCLQRAPDQWYSTFNFQHSIPNVPIADLLITTATEFPVEVKYPA